MQIKKFYAIAAVLLIIWRLVLNIYFINKPIVDASNLGKINSGLDKLEKELSSHIKNNEILIEKLNNISNPNFSSYNDEFSKIRVTTEKICVLVFACNRITIKRNLDQLIKYRVDPEYFPIIVSQDCGHEPTRRLIKSYGNQISFIQHPDLSDIKLISKFKKFKGYYKISRHYKWALNQVFNIINYTSVIIVEDDLDIAPDFFEYFRSLHPILKADPTLWCISAWNDNGKRSLIFENGADILYRTDFFSGLGWMMTKDFWLEICKNWPKAFWDDWIREPNQRKERSCIRPEISRTKTFGKIGVSNGLFYEKHLKFIKLNENYVPFTKMNLTYLLKKNYDINFLKDVYSSPEVTVKQLFNENITGKGSLRITYTNYNFFKKIAKKFGFMDDFKSGVPRTGYRGIVSFAYKERRIHLAPPFQWKGYDLRWT